MKPETQLQIDLVTWLKQTYPNLLFTSTQAGERRSKLRAIMMKRMGYTNGTPDLIIFAAKNGWNGLLLELKDPKGRESEHQQAFASAADIEGYKYKFAYGLDQAKDIITEYLNELL